MGIELKKRQLELARVTLARQELEFRIDERMEEIKRLKENIEIQLAKEEEIKAHLKEMKE